MEDDNKKISKPSDIIDNTVLLDTNVDENCKIYDYARIRNCNILQNSSIGNYTQMDNSNLEDYVRIDRWNHILYSNIGRHSYTGRNTVIIHSGIGRFCSISWNITIGAANHDYCKITTHSFLYDDFSNIRPQSLNPSYNRFDDECMVGNDVWIGANAIILRNLVIGDGAVIAAGSVVTKDVPPYAIVAGVPAKIIKYRFDENIIERLLELKWWNWTDNEIRKYYSYFNVDCNITNLNDMSNHI